MECMIEILMPRHWRWTPFLVVDKLARDVEFQRLFRNTHAPTIRLPALRAAIYWPRPLHLPVGWAHGAYVFWLHKIIWPLARHVVSEGGRLWEPLLWPLYLLEWHGAPPTLRQIRDEN